LACAALCVAAIATGCGGTPAAGNVSAFGAAASIIARDASSAYDAVESISYDVQATSLILDYDTKGFDSARIKPFLAPEDMEARKGLLHALQSYADLLQEVAGNKPIDRLDAEISAFGAQLQSLAGHPALQKIGAGPSDAQISGISAAIQAVGQLLINRERGKSLPGILQPMQDLIDKMCALLSADLGARPNEAGTGGRGLRGQQWLLYDQTMVNRKTFIERNKNALTFREKADEIAKLLDLVKAQRAADEALAATQRGLGDMAKAHHALLDSLKGGGSSQGGSLAGLIAEMQQDAMNISGFYNSLKAR
jgi:hypothetical protein